MKKVVIISIALLLVVGGFLFANRGSDKQREEEVKEKVTAYVNEKYGEEQVESVKSAYDDKHRDEEKRYQIAVKVSGQNLNEDEYMLYRLKDGEVVELGVTSTLPKSEK